MMCGKAPALIHMDEHVGAQMKNRLSMRLYMNGKLIGEQLHLCPETVDFMIQHLTKMRKEFKQECK